MTERSKIVGTVNAAMASRAVLLCEGCPMAQFCAKKQSRPCEAVAEQHVSEGTGGGDRAPVAEPHDYRKQLADDTLSIVIAQPKLKITEPSEKEKRPRQQRQSAVQSHNGAQKNLALSSRAKPVSVAPRTSRRYHGETLGSQVSDLIALAIGKKSADVSRRKK